MSLRRRRALVGLLLAVLAALLAAAVRPAASAARPAGEAPLTVADIGNGFPLASGARLQANDWAGTWTTDHGHTLTWTQSGNHVSGDWGIESWAVGPMEGTVTGNVLRGTWTQSNAYYTQYAAGGPLELTLSADGKSFNGWWSYDCPSSGCHPAWEDSEGDPHYLSAWHTSGGDTEPDECSVAATFSPLGVPRPVAQDCTPPKVALKKIL